MRLFEIYAVSAWVFGCFLSLAFLSLRPYFVVQSSRFLSVLVCLPVPLFAGIVLEGFAPAQSSSAVLVYFVSVALLFALIPIHSLRHRHLFLESTNLRELLDSRVRQLGSDPRGRVPLGADIAFDS